MASTLLAQNLIPRPTTLVWRAGSFTFNDDTRIDSDDLAWPAAEKLAEHLGPNIGHMLPANGRSKNVLAFRIDPAWADLGREGYSLKISRERIEATAQNPAGLFYAVQTIRQLLPASAKGRQSVRCAEIVDVPRFAWRGLMLDVSRHFFPVEVIKKELDLSALFKFNVFHWHLTDDGG